MDKAISRPFLQRLGLEGKISDYLVDLPKPYLLFRRQRLVKENPEVVVDNKPPGFKFL